MCFIDEAIKMIREKCDNEQVSIEFDNDMLEWKVECKEFIEYGVTVMIALEKLYEEAR
jgi:hypothetical protein